MARCLIAFSQFLTSFVGKSVSWSRLGVGSHELKDLLVANCVITCSHEIDAHLHGSYKVRYAGLMLSLGAEGALGFVVSHELVSLAEICRNVLIATSLLIHSSPYCNIASSLTPALPALLPGPVSENASE